MYTVKQFADIYDTETTVNGQENPVIKHKKGEGTVGSSKAFKRKDQTVPSVRSPVGNQYYPGCISRPS